MADSTLNNVPGGQYTTVAAKARMYIEDQTQTGNNMAKYVEIETIMAGIVCKEGHVVVKNNNVVTKGT